MTLVHAGAAVRMLCVEQSSWSHQRVIRGQSRATLGQSRAVAMHAVTSHASTVIGGLHGSDLQRIHGQCKHP
eukprot:1102614-Rhodomonas_salina.5